MAAPPKRATINDLMRHDGRAELIGGRVVELMASGDRPSEVGCNVYVALRPYISTTSRGLARTDGLGYALPIFPSGRESFQPDASYYDGPRPVNRMRFIEGPPTFAVEVRSENDYGPAADREKADKREDYFQAGALVVWDVCPVAEEVRRYRHGELTPTVFRRGDVADAGPAVPGWRISVDDVFEEL